MITTCTTAQRLYLAYELTHQSLWVYRDVRCDRGVQKVRPVQKVSVDYGRKVDAEHLFATEDEAAEYCRERSAALAGLRAIDDWRCASARLSALRSELERTTQLIRAATETLERASSECARLGVGLPAEAP